MKWIIIYIVLTGWTCIIVLAIRSKLKKTRRRTGAPDPIPVNETVIEMNYRELEREIERRVEYTEACEKSIDHYKDRIKKLQEKNDRLELENIKGESVLEDIRRKNRKQREGILQAMTELMKDKVGLQKVLDILSNLL